MTSSVCKGTLLNRICKYDCSIIPRKVSKVRYVYLTFGIIKLCWYSHCYKSNVCRDRWHQTPWRALIACFRSCFTSKFLRVCVSNPETLLIDLPCIILYLLTRTPGICQGKSRKRSINLVLGGLNKTNPEALNNTL